MLTATISTEHRHVGNKGGEQCNNQKKEHHKQETFFNPRHTLTIHNCLLAYFPFLYSNTCKIPYLHTYILAYSHSCIYSYLNILGFLFNRTEPVFKSLVSVIPKPNLAEENRFKTKFNQIFTSNNIGVFKAKNLEIEIGFA